MISFFQNINRSKFCYTLVLVILLIPTYFIHTKEYPDWGDDFAQYVYQAQQINNPSSVYKQLLNVDGYTSGAKRSVFFSVMLSVIQPTLQIQEYVNLNSIFYILAAVCFFLFLSGFFSLEISVAGVLCVFYNFLLLRLKSEVVPEFLFIAFYFIILYLHFNPKKWTKYVTPFLLGLLFSIRFIGLAMLVAYIINSLFLRGKTIREKLLDITLCSLIFCAVIIFINSCFLSNVHNQEVELYGGFLLGNFEFSIFFKNAWIYFSYITLFFEQEIPWWINKVITLVVICFFATGFVNALKNKRGFMEYYFIIYFLFVISYPTNNDTIRYLIPIMPLFAYYTISGINLGLINFNIKRVSIIIVVCLGIVSLSNTKTIWYAMTHQANNKGPYEQSVLKDFDSIKQTVPQENSIAFAKPFVANLLCDRYSYFISEKNYAEVLTKADYYLAPKSSIQELYPKGKKIILSRGDTMDLVNFYLIKLK